MFKTVGTGSSITPNTKHIDFPLYLGHCHLHYKTPRSDLHCIFLHLLDWTLFCFECKDTLYIDSFKRLREAVEVTKRMTENKNVQNPNNSNNPANKKLPGGPSAAGQPAVGLGQPMAANSSKSSNLTKKSSDNAVNNSNNEQKTRGLNNLGNTCFFNSIMQCLNQSHYLGQVLERHCKKGMYNFLKISSIYIILIITYFLK